LSLHAALPTPPRAAPSLRRALAFAPPTREHELAARRAVHDHRVPRLELAAQDAPGQRILDVALDRALERPGAELRVPAHFREHVLGRFGDDEAELALREELGELGELDIDDTPELVALESSEHHDLIEAIDELRTEVTTQRFHRDLALELGP